MKRKYCIVFLTAGSVLSVWIYMNNISFPEWDISANIFQKNHQDHPSTSELMSHCFDVYELDPVKPASVLNSQMVLLINNKTSFRLGDSIEVKIILRDKKGQAKSFGGDQVRVWMVETSKKASVAGFVVDHGNGSYTGHLKALWVGNPVIRSSIAASCEAIGIRHHALKVPGKMKGLRGIFRMGPLTEETDCGPVVDFRGKKFCNFTAENYGLPWYCMRPQNRSLMCQDWVEIQGSYQFQFTKEEQVIMKGHNILKQELQITVTSKDKKTHVEPPGTACNRFPRKETWFLKSPVGFFFQDQWLSTYCSSSIPDSTDKYKECLQNRHILFLGDSTSRQWLEYLEKTLRFTRITKYFHHRPLLTEEKSHNISMFWAPHGYPFLHLHFPNNRGFMKAVHKYLDVIPAGSDDIIIINLYLHFHVYPPGILRHHVKSVVQSVKSLLDRSPKVTVAFKGAHAFHDERIFMDDSWASFYKMIIDTEFAPVQDKVIYINCWDITVCTENRGFHNSVKLDKEMIHTALSHICR